MKITILTGHYYPQIHPRAFRAHELANEFVRCGHSVTVINLTDIDGFDYQAYVRDTGVNVVRLSLYRETGDNSNSSFDEAHQSRFGHFKRRCIDYFLAGALLPKSRLISKNLLIAENTDLVIALSTPFMCLLGLHRYIVKNGKTFVAIADSGDPFFYSKQSRRAIWFKWLEKKVYESYDFLTIPVESAAPSYLPIICEDKIKIIPQGFCMDNLNLFQGERSAPVKFAYAGVFYWDIRNPEFLFEYLNSVTVDFEFHIYMRYHDALFDNMLEKYQNAKAKVYIKYALKHDELLYELSRMDFLVNIENLSNTQMPSKLIDYGMTRRPIFSCRKATFSASKFDSFMKGRYEGQYNVDVEQYDIKNISKQFEALCRK